jgi:hypothetical protein
MNRTLKQARIWIVAGITGLLLLMMIGRSYVPATPEGSAALARENAGGSPQPYALQQAAGGDLVVEITVNPDHPQVNQSYAIRMEIKNQGTQEVLDGFRTYLYIDPADQPPNMTTPDTSENGWFMGLAAGDSYVWERPDEMFRSDGCSEVYVWVDRDNAVAEADETNNLKHITVCTSGATPQPTITPSPTPTPNPGADNYEPDDDCANASTISTDGTVQYHTFDRGGDTDWVRFDATAGTTYLVDASPPSRSRADLQLDVHAACGSNPQQSQSHTFSNGIHQEIPARRDGPIYLKFSDKNPGAGGAGLSYNVSVQTLSSNRPEGVRVVVSGKYRDNDPLQANIDEVIGDAYYLFKSNSTNPKEQIRYLAPDTSLDIDGDGQADVDLLATSANLEQVITQWAPSRVSDDGFFTLYIMDHGANNRIYLDGTNQDIVTPQQLDSWLTRLEEARPDIDLKINVILESCYSGSFIAQPESISKVGRLIIASAGARELAYASQNGAEFSDAFIAELVRKQSVYNAFDKARSSLQAGMHRQNPMLDGNGNGKPNEQEDYQIAQTRGFASETGGTFDNEDFTWPPYIVEAVGTEGVIQGGKAEIRATVRDNIGVEEVWAIVYPPSYVPPEDGEDMVPVPYPKQPLTRQSGTHMDGEYTLTLTNVVESGTYQVVVYAIDAAEAVGQPVAVEVVSLQETATPTPTETVTPTPTATPTPDRVFLPIVKR